MSLTGQPGEDPEQVPLRAVCVPLNTVGRSIGVLHLTTPARKSIATAVLNDLETIADRVGTRLEMLRVMEQTLLQAATDPLTGLLNWRSVENQLHELICAGAQFALAMGDLDHFKVLNDAFGHDIGDRALQVFARSMRSALRDNDVVSRYGGEEFVLLFPGLSAEEAGMALERVRESLALSIAAGGQCPAIYRKLRGRRQPRRRVPGGSCAARRRGSLSSQSGGP